MIANKVSVDTKTGKVTKSTFYFTPPPPLPEGIGINPQKLINVLIDKGIIISASELK